MAGEDTDPKSSATAALSKALELLNNSGEEWWTPSDITYSVVMHGFRREGKLKESCDVVAQMLQKGFFPTTVEINLLIHALCKEGKPAEAKDFMEQCQSKGCTINVINFTTVITAGGFGISAVFVG
ncbi:hypothetical protein TRIUR3_12949 [Triticum urartu]|uniref:Pentatricopeptide repeat-containing protein n=1 Tax=Triticum urartu TaxID=4572 RepID=M7Z299_TRIUA|nr:hypothetical protein TRIUR3_12949 [Triticum urartu]